MNGACEETCGVSPCAQLVAILARSVATLETDVLVVGGGSTGAGVARDAAMRGFEGPDAAIDPWKLVSTNARSAAEHGARILPYHRVDGLEVRGDKVVGARVVDEVTGDDVRIRSRVVVNAAGAWAGRIAELADCRVTVLPGKGIMIAMNHRLVNTVVNRCKLPSDGDIIVPIRTVSVIGTTDIRVADPDELEVTQGEVDEMLDEGQKLVPGFRDARALRLWAGARPLCSP